MYKNYLKTVPYHCEQRNNDKVYKTISKMAEPSKNGVQKVLFLTEVDFRVPLYVRSRVGTKNETNIKPIQ